MSRARKEDMRGAKHFMKGGGTRGGSGGPDAPLVEDRVATSRATRQPTADTSATAWGTLVDWDPRSVHRIPAKKRERAAERGFDTPKPTFPSGTTLHSGPKKRPGVFDYLDPTFADKHVRHINPKKESSEAAFTRDTQEMASRRMRNSKPSFGGMESRDVPASTMVGMNRRNLKEMKRFIKDPSTQRDLAAERPVTFPVTTKESPRRTARAVTVEPTRVQEYSGPGFTGFAFSSKHRRKNAEGFVMPDHFEEVTGTAKNAPMGKSKKF